MIGSALASAESVLSGGSELDDAARVRKREAAVRGATRTGPNARLLSVCEDCICDRFGRTTYLRYINASDADNFVFSSNMHAVAQANGWCARYTYMI